jgi:hypothetical protein
MTKKKSVKKSVKKPTTRSFPKHVLDLLPSLPELATELRAAMPAQPIKLTSNMCRHIIGSLLGSLIQLSDAPTVRSAMLACNSDDVWDTLDSVFGANPAANKRTR